MYPKNSVVEGALMLIAFACWISANSSEAFGTFGFDIHHRYSDTVKDFLNLDGLPEKGTLDYYSAMAHHDQLFKARRLAGAVAPSSSPYLSFFGSNQTYRIRALGFLQYSLVAVGTPPVIFLVALDTSSDLFWLPCDCPTCARSFNISAGNKFDLAIYSPSNSTTSVPLPCNSTMCGRRRGCSTRLNACAYQEVYLSSNTSSAGILVDDVLHLGNDGNSQDFVEAPITLGCGMNQTGDFLERSGINGVFGLGMDNISVPSILANKGLVANSFSMCFGRDGSGRIEFGDKGVPDQKITPFNLQQLRPNYNIIVTQIALGNNVTDIEFTAIFDSGSSFTHLNDPAYSFILNSVDSQLRETRYQSPTKIIFDYCYELNATQNSFITPTLTLTMKGGSLFNVTVPAFAVTRQGGGLAYCLAIVRSVDINIIGRNFMTGYRIVFDREEMVLGWTESDCYDSISSSHPSTPPEPSPRNRTSRSPPPPPPPTTARPSSAARLSSVTARVVMVMFAIFAHYSNSFT